PAASATPGAAPSDAALAALNRRLDDALVAAKAARERADAAAKSVAEMPRPSPQPDTDNAAERAKDRAALDALAARVASLEGTAKSLADRITRSNEAAASGGARELVAALALRLAVERSAPYTRELAALDSTADTAARDALAPFAASGVPPASALARELVPLLPAARKAAEEPAKDSGGSGFLDRLQTSAERLVHVRPIGMPPGDDAAATVARIE